MESPKTGRENHQIVPFTFENHTVRTAMVENDPWFIAKDVCEALSLGNVSEKIKNLPSNELTSVQLMSGGQKRKMSAVNEPGLYRLIFQSRKAEAEKFKTWVFAEVLPSIRRTGFFMPEGMNEMIRRTVADVVGLLERESLARRGTLLTGEERRFIEGHARYPVWRIAALTGRGEATIRRILKTVKDGQPTLFEEAAPWT